MFGRGSPRLNLFQVAAAQRNPSPKTSRVQKKKPSPKAVPDRPRAHWNAGLEKGLVELLHDHNNDHYRGQNGWSPDAWNRIVKLFYEKFPYVNFTKTQIQDKERELKREYRLLKEARKQSGASWDDKLCMIVADQAVWNNIITSHRNAKKFQNKSFPLFEALGELYDGQIAEGTLNFTSIAPSQVNVTQPFQVPITQPSQVAPTQTYQATVTQPYQAPITQPFQVPVTQPSQATVTQHNMGEEDESLHFDSFAHDVETDDEDLRILEQPVARDATARSRMGKRGASTRNKDNATSDKTKKAAQRRRQDGQVVEMMGRFIEMKEKQAEDEMAKKEKARTNASEEFSIPMCISIVDSMEELSDDEKVLAYGVFKDAQNRSIFMSAKPSTRLKWLRREVMQG
ncbi:uncharacterized protein LOC8066651 isoform X2 [Sorghum bicolor]|uniref:uncharacterized protein LOC8066651 isoform X2 n=1 Tax=Sorghum bicolor TaxID=4558 RepID=UPI000B4245C7|nr:uncharacterized protein LOC8066651 isoform X2 [Sorghum bicolor]|eukprot:XP_021302740.1 uncharacterized protein LOC8066651 isoform X2 [Sorghum bicolor]